MNYRVVIKNWKINLGVIAGKIGMPKGTFNNKFRDNQTVYKFTQEEEEKINLVLLELASEINGFKAVNSVNGISTKVKEEKAALRPVNSEKPIIPFAINPALERLQKVRGK